MWMDRYSNEFIFIQLYIAGMKDLKEQPKSKESHTLIRMYNVSEHYKILEKVGRGTYGTVFKVKALKDNKFYAIKKLQNNDVKLQQEGFPITALRQITLLKQIDHPNIIKLKEIILSKPNKRNLYRGSTFLLFQYMDHDFAGLFKTKHKFSIPEVKCIIKQLLEGVNYLHTNKILHRDIKSANILINDEGEVKLADFGLGRKIKMENIFTYKVVTLWYRAPELLWGCKTYSDRIDIWSLGCVVCQFFTGEVLFRKQTQSAQIQRIYEICGDFQANQIKLKDEDYKNYQYINEMKPKKTYSKELKQYLVGKCPSISQITIDFIQSLLHLDPSKRLSCDEALRHPFFNEKPTACPRTQIQKQQYECHEMFKDRSIKIQRILKNKQEQNESKNFKNSNNRPEKHYKEYRPYPKHQKRQRNINSSSSARKYSSSSQSSGYSSQKDRKRRSSRQNNSKKYHRQERKGRDYNHQDNRKERQYKNELQDKRYKYDEKRPYKNEREKKEYAGDKYDKYDSRYKNKEDKRKQDRRDERKDDRSERKDERKDDRREERVDRKDDRREERAQRKDVRRQDIRTDKRSEDYHQSNDNRYDKHERYDKHDKYEKERESKADYYKDKPHNDRDKPHNDRVDRQRGYVNDKQKDYKRREQVGKYDYKQKQRGYEKYQHKQKYKGDHKADHKSDHKGELRGDYKGDYRKQVSQKKGDKFVYTRNQRVSSSSRSSFSSRNNNTRKEHRKYGYERKGNYKKQHSSTPQHYR